MHKFLLATAAALSIASWDAKAQTDLSAYADANGFLDVQRLTCAQLAGTWQGDADMLMAWYSGWYNGLAKKHFYHGLARQAARARSHRLLQGATSTSGSSTPWR